MSSATSFPFRPEVEDALRRTDNRLRNFVGHSKKNRHIRIQPVIAIYIIVKEDFTIDFSPTNPEVRDWAPRLTIWQWLALKYPLTAGYQIIDRPSRIQQYESMRLHSRTVRSAFKTLQREISGDWGKLPLLMVPRHPGSGPIEVITFNRDYEVSANYTAGKLSLIRHKDRFKSHAQTALIKGASLEGSAEFARVKKWMQKCIEQIQYQGLIQPMLSFSEEPAAIEG